MNMVQKNEKLQPRNVFVVVLIALSVLAIQGLGLGVSLSSAAADEPEPQEGLVARWTFNDDCYGYEDTVGDPEFLDDSPIEGGRSVRFDGGNALILGDAEELKPEELTLSFWVRRTGSMTGGGWGILMDASTGGGRYGEGWGLGKWGATETLFILDDEDRLRRDSETDLNDLYSQSWMHLAFTFDADREIFQIFQNGEEIASYEDMHGFWTGSWDSASITAHETPVSLGALSDGSEGVPLDFSDVRIYNRVLDAGEVSQLTAGVEFFEVGLGVNPDSGGSVSGDGEYVAGSEVTVSAEPEKLHGEDLYDFSGWYEDGEKDSSEIEYTFTANADTDLVGEFERNETISIDIVAEEGGSVEGDGEYVRGSEITVEAELEEFYSFEGWFEDGEKLAYNLDYTFVGENDRDLTARFEEKDTVYINLTAKSEEQGNVAGEGRYVKGKDITLAAEPEKVYGDDLYRFEGWYENGEKVSAEAEYTFAGDNDRNFVARFERMEDMVVVGLKAVPDGGGKLEGAGVYNEGEEVTVTAQPADSYFHYEFDGWFIDEDKAAFEKSYDFKAEEDIVLVAEFTELEVEAESKFFFATSDTHVIAREGAADNTIRTIEIMNELPGTEFPHGGEVLEPEGLIIAGDLHEADENQERNWEEYERLFDPAGDALFEYPVFEGIGNHDFGANYIELVSENNQRRPVDDLYTCEQDYHYTWEWSGVRMIQLHAFPGKGGPIYEEGNNRDRGWNNPEDSLIFLEHVLEEKVIGNQPIILTFHYGFGSWGQSWWSNKERDWFEDVIDGYNIALIIHGHSHAYKHYTWRGYNIMETGDPHGEIGRFTVYRINRENDMLEIGQHGRNGWSDERSFSLID